MTAAHDPTDHHMAAARHHEQAAYFHREASRHYQIGKDYAHAAHQALVAHGHELRAMEHGQEARAAYARHEGSPLPGYLARATPQSTAVAAPQRLTGAEHHVAAAGHHDAASQRHVKAGAHGSADHHIRAHHETQKALDHGKHAIFHADQAALAHMELYGCQPEADTI